MHPFTVANLKPALQGKKILLGISGSIAAFKACDIVRHLRACGAEVRVVLTDSAQRFVTVTTLETLSGHPVFTSLWGEAGAQGTHHIDAARWADLALVAPATAHTIARLAHGLADDLLSTELLAFKGPVIVAPAMNPAMYEHPATQANLKTLASRGTRVAGPGTGLTSCGEEGLGRMLEPEQLVEEAARAFYAPANGKRLLVTLGPTRSAVDPVRYLSNRSSGLMGAALCWAGRRAGYEVSAVAGPVDTPLPGDARVVRVETTREMLEAASREFEQADVFAAAAAVLDWDIANPSAGKRSKEQGKPSLELAENPDILATLAARKSPRQFVLGFAAETSDVVRSATRKRVRKQCDAIFANDVSRSDQGFESADNGGWWIGASGAQELAKRPKAALAAELLALVAQERAAGPRPPAPPRGLPRPDDIRIG